MGAVAQIPDWAKKIGNGSNVEIPMDAEVGIDPSGNIILTGSFRDYPLVFDTTTLYSAGVTDIYVAKWNSTGQFLWARRIGCDKPDFPEDLAIDENGNILVTGSVAESTTICKQQGALHVEDAGIFKLDPAGNLLWSKRLLGDVACSGTGIATDHAGNVFASGVFTTKIYFEGDTLQAYNDSWDGFLVKYAPDSTFLWALKVGGRAQEFELFVETDKAKTIAILSYYYGGEFRFTWQDSLPTPDWGYDGALGFYNQAGQFQAGVHIKGTGNQFPISIKYGEDGAFYVAGYFSDSLWMGNYYFDGNPVSHTAFIARVFANGLVDWVKIPSATGATFGRDMAPRPGGGMYFTGNYAANCNFGSVVYPFASANEVFVLEIDSNGNFISGFNLGSAADDRPSSIASEPGGGIAITGEFNAQLIVGSDTLNPLLADAFLVKYCKPNSLSSLQIADSFFCRGSGISLSYQADGCFSSTNAFVFELSDSNGNFAQALRLDSVVSMYAAQPQWLQIPLATLPGNAYRIRVRSTNPASQSMDNGFNLHILPDTIVQFQITGDSVICPYGIAVNLDVPNTFVSYLWSTGETTPSISVLNPGVYWASVRSSAGCSSQDQIQVDECVSSWQDKKIFSLKIYPNPLYSVLYIESESEHVLQAELFSLEGKPLRKNEGTGKLEMDCSGLANGYYLLRSKQEGKQRTDRLLKIGE